MESAYELKAQHVNFSGIECQIEVSGSDVENRVTVIKMTVDPGTGAPPYISAQEDKYFRILEGHFAFQIGDQTQNAVAGATLTVQRGDVHGFTNMSASKSILLLVATPGGHDTFFREMSELAAPHDPSEVFAVARQNGQVITGLNPTEKE